MSRRTQPFTGLGKSQGGFPIPPSEQWCSRAVAKRHRPGFARLDLRQAGFTIIELMIATIVFSVILTTITYGVIHFTNAYYKGLNSSKTQDTTRQALDTISQAIQFSGAQVYPSAVSGSITYFCAGGEEFFTSVGAEFSSQTAVSPSNIGLFEQPAPTGTGCPSSPAALTPNTSTGKELLGDRMRVTAINVSGGANNLYTISIRVAFGDNDLLTGTTGPNVQCKLVTGSQFCAVVSLSSTVEQRVVN